MKKHVLFAAAALTLVSATPPPMPNGPAGPAGSGNYPYCSRTVRDHCVQRHDRTYGSESTAVLADEGRGGPYEPPPPASVPSATARTDYPPCSSAVQDRCVQGHRHIHHARSVRRAGERG
jgi:hypothetical protein